MDKRNAERLFVQVMTNIEKKYEDECNMCIDVFLEDAFTVDECKRMMAYLLEKVKPERKAMVQQRIEKELGPLADAM